jgi:hypothetical protein
LPPISRDVARFDELGEKKLWSGFVCDAHKVRERVEKLAQPQIAKAAV